MRGVPAFRTAHWTQLGVLLLLCLLPGRTSTAGEVAQGRCVEYSPSGSTLRLQEYDPHFSRETPYGRSSGIFSVFDTSRARIGIRPEKGDILRISFVLAGGTRKAVKIMNVSKQESRKR